MSQGRLLYEYKELTIEQVLWKIEKKMELITVSSTVQT